MADETRWTRDSTVVFSEISDGHAALLDTDGGVYYSLNPAGATVWQQLEEPCTLAELTTALTTAFDVPAEVAARDIEALLADLSQRGLVRGG